MTDQMTGICHKCFETNVHISLNKYGMNRCNDCKEEYDELENKLRSKGEIDFA